MTIEEENGLIGFVRRGNRVIWMPDDRTAREVVGFGDRDNEPGKCALFSRGEYASLMNADFNEFVAVSKISLL